jgi:type III secretory pathway component EscS
VDVRNARPFLFRLEVFGIVAPTVGVIPSLPVANTPLNDMSVLAYILCVVVVWIVIELVLSWEDV